VAKNFLVADGKQLKVYQHGTELEEVVLGPATVMGAPSWRERRHSAAGRRRLPAASCSTSDACVDNTVAAIRFVERYDHVGASIRISLPLIPRLCAGPVVRMLARIQIPNKPKPRPAYPRSIYRFSHHASGRGSTARISDGRRRSKSIALGQPRNPQCGPLRLAQNAHRFVAEDDEPAGPPRSVARCQDGHWR